MEKCSIVFHDMIVSKSDITNAYKINSSSF